MSSTPLAVAIFEFCEEKILPISENAAFRQWRQKIKNERAGLPACPVSGLPIERLCSGCWANLVRENYNYWAPSVCDEAQPISSFAFFAQCTLSFKLSGESKTYLFCFEKRQKERQEPPYPPAILALYAALAPLPFYTNIFSGQTYGNLRAELTSQNINADFAAIAISPNSAPSLALSSSYANSASGAPEQLSGLEPETADTFSEVWLVISKYAQKKADPFDFEAYKKFISALPLVFVCFSLYGELFYHNAFGKNLLGKKFYHTLKKVARLAYQKQAVEKNELNFYVISAAELQQDYDQPAVHWLVWSAELNGKSVLYVWGWLQSLEWNKQHTCNHYYLCSQNIGDIPLLFFSEHGKFYFASPCFWKYLGIEEYENLKLSLEHFVALPERLQLELMQVAQKEKTHFFNIFYSATHISYLTLLEARLAQDAWEQVFILIKCSFLKPIDSIATFAKLLHAFCLSSDPQKNIEEPSYFFIDENYQIIHQNKKAARFVGEKSFLSQGGNLISIVKSNGEREISALELFFETDDQDFFEETVWALKNDSSSLLELEELKICALKNIASPPGQTRHLICVQSLENRLQLPKPFGLGGMKIRSNFPIAYIMWNEAEEIMDYNEAASAYLGVNRLLSHAPAVASFALEWREKQTINISNTDNVRNIHCCQVPFYADAQKQKLLIIQDYLSSQPLNETEMLNLQEAIEERLKAYKDSAQATLERLQKEISGRQAIEKQLQVSNHQLELIMRQLPGILWTADLQLKITSYRGAENIFPQLAKIEGASVYDIFASSPVLEPAIRSHLKAINGEKLHFEYPFGEKTYEVSLEPMRDEKNALIGCIALALDISQRKREELEMKNALEKANELNDLKSKFIAMASHEFKTPLSVISLSSQMLRRNFQNWEPEKREAYFNRIEQAVQRLTETLEDVILIGQVESEQRNVNRKEVCLESFIQEILADLQSTFHTHSLDIRYEKNFSYEYVRFEPHIVRTVLTNILSNAVKYSGFSQPVFLKASSAASELQFIIEDRGIGIPQKDLDKVFEPFYRCSNVEKITGSGLGLTIVKKMVELAGGNIQIQSQEGKGTVVCLTFPLVY